MPQNMTQWWWWKAQIPRPEFESRQVENRIEAKATPSQALFIKVRLFQQ